MKLTPFKSLIMERCGLSFDDAREAILLKGIKDRLAERVLASHEEYYDLLSREQDEFNRLINLITINETYFFREPAHFTLLTDELIPEIRASRRGEGRIKIVSAGCSTGEEPYTIVMALHEKFGTAFGREFSVIGFDIDEAALKAAGEGVYPRHSFRGVPDHVKEKYFTGEGVRYRIKDHVREGAEFHHVNILGDSYPDAVRDADVIFYRNVSIYFSSDAQQRIFTNLAELLGEKGYLFLSSTETFFHNIGVLSLVEKRGIYLYSKGFEVRIEERRRPGAEAGEGRARRRGAPTPRLATGTSRSSDGRRAKALSPRESRKGEGVKGVEQSRKRGDAQDIFHDALLLAEKKHYEEALGLLDRAAELNPAFVKAHTLKAGILVNLERLDEAEAACLRSIEVDRWCLEGCLLLGLIAKIRGDLEEAKKRFKEAVYVRSSCWPAHFYLGEIFRIEGDIRYSRREFDIVIALLTEGRDTRQELAFLNLSFSPEQIVHLCRHNLALME